MLIDSSKNKISPVSSSPSFREQKPFIPSKEIIREIALETFKEFAVCAVFTGAACYFADRKSLPYIVGSVLLIPPINGFFRLARKYFEHIDMDVLEELKEKGTLTSKVVFKIVFYVIKWMPHYCSLTFSALDVMTRNLLIHEAGHAFAAKAIYWQANPKITVFFMHAHTEFKTNKLTAFGQSLGNDYARAFVTAAGTGAAIVDASANLILAHSIRKKNPELSRHLRWMAGLSVVSHMFYAISAMWESTSGHDFASLKRRLGIHPLISALAIPILPLICQSACWATSRLLQPAATSASAA